MRIGRLFEVTIGGLFIIIIICVMIIFIYTFGSSFYYSIIYDSSCLENIAERYCINNNREYRLIIGDCCPTFKFNCDYQENEHKEPEIEQFIFTEEELRSCGVKT